MDAMKLETSACTTWFGRGHAVLSAVMIACSCSMLLGCKKTSEPPAPTAVAARVAEDPAARDLRAIGDRVVMAMVAKNINTLLEYDRNPDDEISLRSKSGELYCYLFDSSCIQGANKRAIYELLSTSPQLGIDASVANVGGEQYGLLMFYDRSQISDHELYSPDFRCTDKALKRSASWHFIRADGKWTTSTLFDFQTDNPCKQ